MIPDGYKDPKTETLANGRRVADIIGARGPKGLIGAIVSPSGIDGRPINFNPHDNDEVRINVDPDNPHGASLTLKQFTKNAVTQAMKTAADKIVGNDISAVRERTAVAFEELAKLANAGVAVQKAADRAPAITRKLPQEQPITPPAPDELPDTDYAPPELIDRTYSPMAAFGLKQASRGQHSQPARAAASAGPPKKLVYFEKEGIGTVPAFFHDIVLDVAADEDDAFTESGFMVLVYDLRFEQAAARWFPPANDPYKRPWAVQINNDRKLYLVHTTGFQYVYDDREFCVLLVEKAVTGD
jgi:hypothetical protein